MWAGDITGTLDLLTHDSDGHDDRALIFLIIIFAIYFTTAMDRFDIYHQAMDIIKSI